VSTQRLTVVKRLAEAARRELTKVDIHHPDGAMVAVFIPEQVAGQLRQIADGLGLPAEAEQETADNMHVTLAYFPDADKAKENSSRILGCIQAVALRYQVLDGKIQGWGVFNGQDGRKVLYASLDIPELPAIRQAICENLEAAGLEYAKDHGFEPHITLTYFPESFDFQGVDVPDMPAQIDGISMAFGEKYTTIALGSGDTRVGKVWLGSRMVKVVWPQASVSLDPGPLDKAFDPTKHPRVKSGKGGGEFTSGGGGGGAAVAAPAKPAAGGKKPHYPATADMSAGGKASVAGFKAKHYHAAIDQLAEYGKKNLVGGPGGAPGGMDSGMWNHLAEQAKRMDDPEHGFQAIAAYGQKVADKAGKGAEFKAMREKLRVAGWRGAGRVKIAHGGPKGAAPAAGGPAAAPAAAKPAKAPKAAPAAVPAASSGLPDLSPTEVNGIKEEVAGNAIRNMYLRAKGKIGKNDELFALQHKVGHDMTGVAAFHRGVKDILERNGHPGEMDEIDEIAQDAVSEFDDKVDAARRAKLPAAAAPAGKPKPLTVKSVKLADAEKKAIAAPIWHKHIDALAESAIAHGIRGGDVLRAWKEADDGANPENAMLDFKDKLKGFAAGKMADDEIDNHYFVAGEEMLAAQKKALAEKKAKGVGTGDAFHGAVLAAVPPAHARLLQMYHDNEATLERSITGGGINDDTTYKMKIAGDGSVCAKGTSSSHSSDYGFPGSEVCAYEASALIGFHSVQPTAYKTIKDPASGKDTTMSVQTWLDNGVRGSDVRRQDVKETPALRASVSEMIAFDFGMANRDRNPGNWMYDKDSGEMRGIDNGLVGLEAGRSSMSPGELARYARRNCESYCRTLLSEDPERIVQKADVAKVKAFVNSPKFDQLVEEHYGQGVGADDLKKNHLTLAKFTDNWKKACLFGIERLENMVGKV
jgi:2'-5' RNA ligase